MAINWREYLELARWLQTNTPPGMSDECARRCAVSRAYFAAFCFARNYALAYLGFTERKDSDDHGRLRAHLKAKRRRKTAESLDRLRQWRNACDYNDDVGDMTALDAMLTSALDDSEYVFTSLVPPTKTP
jgi:hypothetical protein